MHTNAELARQNMIENQVRPWEVLDPRVLDVLSAVRREDFVPARYRNSVPRQYQRYIPFDKR